MLNTGGIQMKKVDNSTSHISEEYDHGIADTIPYYGSFHDETINLIKIILNEPRIWLDTGCGTGTLVYKAFDRFKNTKFILNDPSIEMLNIAQSKLSKLSQGRLEFLESNETGQISLKSNPKPDVITAIQAHHYLSRAERIQTTKHCYSLLNSNGVYITFENIRPSTAEGVEIGKQYWKKFQVARGRDTLTVDKHLTRFDTEYFPIKTEEHKLLLEKAGFRTVEMFWMSYMQAGFYGIK